VSYLMNTRMRANIGKNVFPLAEWDLNYLFQSVICTAMDIAMQSASANRVFKFMLFIEPKYCIRSNCKSQLSSFSVYINGCKLLHIHIL